MTVCFYHVTYAFQSESTIYSCLVVKEHLARNRREIWSSSDCNGTRTHNHLVRKQTLNYLDIFDFHMDSSSSTAPVLNEAKPQLDKSEN